jgi:hypothetical protein
MSIGFDFISDLNLSPEENFNWENKATSLYCIVAGNVSSDLKTVKKTFSHLCKFYQGVFYIPGSLEFSDKHGVKSRVNDLKVLLASIKNLVLLHNHVVIIDSIAVVGINGWSPEYLSSMTLDKIVAEVNRTEDLGYLANSIERLQLHIDVKKIIVVSHAIPRDELYFNEAHDTYSNLPELADCLILDKERKISHWVFGTQHKIVDITIDDINYLNNVYTRDTPYWPKRLEV